MRNIKIYLWHFNPRSDERSDLLTFQYQTTMIMLFQSTLRRTERLVQQGLNILRSDFNPRSDERSDYISGTFATSSLISIHAPTNGATVSIFCSTASIVNFNPRSDERSDYRRMFKGTDRLLFQSTLRRTERLKYGGIEIMTLYISIHAPTNGATAIEVDCTVSNYVFQSTLRRTERRSCQ